MVVKPSYSYDHLYYCYFYSSAIITVATFLPEMLSHFLWISHGFDHSCRSVLGTQ